MAIVTGIQPFTLWRNVGFAVLCAVFGVWGWYDYAIKIPRLEVDSAIYEKAKDTRSTLEKLAETKPLDDAQIKQMEDAKKDLSHTLYQPELLTEYLLQCMPEMHHKLWFVRHWLRNF